MSDEKFIERNMYHNKGDKNPKKPLIANIVIGVIFLVMGFYFYNKITTSEQTGEEIYLPRLLWLCYDYLGGAIGVLGVFVFIGGGVIYKGYTSYRNKES